MIHRGGTFAPESSAWVTPKDESGKLDKPNYPFFRQEEKRELGKDPLVISDESERLGALRWHSEGQRCS